MPWIPSEVAASKGRRGGKQPLANRIRCDQCSWGTKNWYWGVKHSRQDAGVWWRVGFLQGTSERAAACPRCASATCEAASQSYESTSLDVERVMSAFWMDPTGRAVVPANTTVAATAHRDQEGPPKAPLPSASSSQAHRGRAPPKAPPPGISLMTTEERLAVLEKMVAELRLQVAELQKKHPSDAAVG